MYSNIDDLIFDENFRLVFHIFESAVIRFYWDYDEINTYFSDINKIWDEKVPKEKQYEWCDYLWEYDVREWKECDDDRAWPHTHYNYNLGRILEFRAYDLRHIMMEWLAENKTEIYKMMKQYTPEEQQQRKEDIDKMIKKYAPEEQQHRKE